jgi:hypothetical protein
MNWIQNANKMTHKLADSCHTLLLALQTYLHQNYGQKHSTIREEECHSSKRKRSHFSLTQTSLTQPAHKALKTFKHSTASSTVSLLQLADINVDSPSLSPKHVSTHLQLYLDNVDLKKATLERNLDLIPTGFEGFDFEDVRQMLKNILDSADSLTNGSYQGLSVIDE